MSVCVCVCEWADERMQITWSWSPVQLSHVWTLCGSVKRSNLQWLLFSQCFFSRFNLWWVCVFSSAHSASVQSLFFFLLVLCSCEDCFLLLKELNHLLLFISPPFHLFSVVCWLNTWHIVRYQFPLGSY